MLKITNCTIKSNQPSQKVNTCSHSELVHITINLLFIITAPLFELHKL